MREEEKELEPTEFREVLVIIAHPDDAELSAGGSIARWAREGATVRTVVCTNGDKGTKDDVSPFDLAKTREAEQLEASRILGVRETLFLRHRDGELEDTRAFRNQIAFLIRHFKPDTILTHDPWRTHYQHPDHQAIGHATFKAVIYARDQHFLPELGYAGIDAHHTNNLLYLNSREPNFFVDITDTFDAKMRAICAHKCQIKNPEQMEKRMRERLEDAGRQAGFAVAEPFTIARMRKG